MADEENDTSPFSRAVVNSSMGKEKKTTGFVISTEMGGEDFFFLVVMMCCWGMEWCWQVHVEEQWRSGLGRVYDCFEDGEGRVRWLA